MTTSAPGAGGASPATARLGAFDVTFDRCGILAILKNGDDVFGACPPPWNNRRRPARIGELLLEPDFGDAWGKRVHAPAVPGIDFGNLLLGDHHLGVSADGQSVRWTGRYRGGDWKVKRLAWTTTLQCSRDGRRLEFVTALDWDTGSRRIRAVFPVKSTAASAFYEVPFGFIERAFDASKLDYSIWNSHTMEFPTLHWLWRPIDEQRGVALLNKGLPCNRWTPGLMDLSLVRSPEYCFCVVEPGSYEFWDTDGQRDAGRHTFEYSLLPYYHGLTPGELTRLGYEYNRPAPVQPPFAVEGDVVVTAWKLAEDGRGWILRLQEAGGTGTTVRLPFGGPRSVTKTDLLERPLAPAVRAAKYEAPLHRHGILTLRIR